uniref:Craniofacial development protein 1 n=1 Tax=Sphenodon punctatus TaxID=8508 RepID=A0A8D0GW30_SPHPU
MSDSEYSSAEDEDYLPSGEEYSEDDLSELVKEDEEKPCKEKGQKSSRGTMCRKRKKAGLLLEPEEGEGEKDSKSDNKEEEMEKRCLGRKESKPKEEEKKKEDALWANFLSDIGQKSNALAAAQMTSTQNNKATEEKSSHKPQWEEKEPEKPKDAAKLMITKVFDFAGEEVRVTKEVDAVSKEAKSFLKQQEMS